ncbi:MAG TPA: hypothetical protein VM434_00540 [Beijerinckiaceae bacterium]|nr:hypothetical protein [Beijerinckiaceae bacterium]
MTLEATKRRLSRKYLGQKGVHGVGTSPETNAVRIHLEEAGPARAKEQKALLDEIEREAAPYSVQVTFEGRATKLG